MKEEFDKFEQWLSTNYSDGLLDLNPAATDSEIEELTSVIGIELPEDFVNILKIHNGQKGDAAWLFDSQEFLSTHRIIEEFNKWKELWEKELKEKVSKPDIGVKNDWWNKAWIPFTSDGAGNSYCLDLNPNETGTKGQVITLWHEFSEREIVAKNFTLWFKEYVKELESGELFYSKEYNSIVYNDEI